MKSNISKVKREEGRREGRNRERRREERTKKINEVMKRLRS
jgi:hypothetical protein